MANSEHLARLHDGVTAWNTWRKESPQHVFPDLSWADLSGKRLRGADLHQAHLGWVNLHRAGLCMADLRGAYLGETTLVDADLSGAKLGGARLCNARLTGATLRAADLRQTDLHDADCREADFRKAKLSGAILEDAHFDQAIFYRANLTGANLRGANLTEANLTGANLSGADLSEACLSGVNFYAATLENTSLSEAFFSGTMLINVDLSTTKGLETCRHAGASVLDPLTLQRSGPLPLAFLRGCGLSDWEIEAARLYEPGLKSEQITDIVYRIHDLRATRPIQIHNLFISYSHADGLFLEHMERHLNERGVRFWRDAHDAPAGPLEDIIVRAIRHNPTVLLVLSKNSVGSDWVEYEAQTARELEKELGRYVLCPITLDESWKTCKWSAVLRNQIKKYNVLDFSDWQDATAFKDKFQLLLSGIDLFYADDSPLP